MGQTVDQIEDHIESSREDLRSNLEELGQKVRSTVDWRQRFQANPGAILAVAFGGGFILAKVLGGSRTGSIESRGTHSAAELSGTAAKRRGSVLRAWDDIQSALVGVVAAKVTETLAEAIPGFSEQVSAREKDGRVVNNGADTPNTAH